MFRKYEEIRQINNYMNYKKCHYTANVNVIINNKSFLMHSKKKLISQIISYRQGITFY